MQRLFFRQTIDLSGATSQVDADLNQLGKSQTANRLVLTIGKINVTDVFDTNKFAHDFKHDFLNWALIDTGTFDYAADAWGYTVGGAAEWYQGSWTLRTGLFDLSNVPNSTTLDSHFGQFQLVEEIERRYRIAGEDEAIRLAGFLSRGRMGSFADAIALGLATELTPQHRFGASVPQPRRAERQYRATDHQVSGSFPTAGFAGGNVEPYEFADIDRTVSGGLSPERQEMGPRPMTPSPSPASSMASPGP